MFLFLPLKPCSVANLLIRSLDTSHAGLRDPQKPHFHPSAPHRSHYSQGREDIAAMGLGHSQGQAKGHVSVSVSQPFCVQH